MKITKIKSANIKKLSIAAANAKLFPVEIKIKGLPKLEAEQMTETDFDDAAMKVSNEMAER